MRFESSRGVIPLLTLLALTSCGSEPCSDGFTRGDDGNCHADTTDTLPGDTSLTDTSVAPEWYPLPEACEESSGLAEDPLVLLDWPEEGEPAPGEAFLEMVDLIHAPDEQRIYAAGQGGLIVWDLTTSSVVGTFPQDGRGRYHHVELIDEALVAVTHRDRGLEIMDLSGDRAVDFGVEYSWPFIGGAGMAWAPPYLYIVGQNGQLMTLELDGDGAPTPVITVEGLGSPWEMVIDGDMAWIADNALGVVPVDLSDPARPELGDPVQTVGGALDIAISGAGTSNRALHVATGSSGVETFSLSSDGTPTSSSRTNYSTSIVSVAVADDILWAVGHEDVAVLHLLDPASPTPIAREETPAFGMHVEASGTTGWVADWGHLGIYEVNSSLEAPSMDLSVSEVTLESGSQRELTIRNRGAAPLELFGATTGDSRLTIEASELIVDPGSDASLRLTLAEGEEQLDTTLCLSTNDPDGPTIEVPVTSTSTVSASHGVGEPAPDFTLTDLDGNSHRLSEQLGHPVVLVYFATW